MKKATILWGATELGAPHFSSDILWRCGFQAPDPFFLVEGEKENYLLASPLEIGRAKKESRVDHMVLLGPGSQSAALIVFLKKHGVRAVSVPHGFPHGIARDLGAHFSVDILSSHVYPKRVRKSAREIALIAASAAATERAILEAVKFLRICSIRGRRIYFEKEIVTSEHVRGILEDALWREGYMAAGTIVSSGSEAAHPHAAGRGPLRAHAPIVMDVFPVSRTTHYWADETRTVFKGEPDKAMARMYETVRGAQRRAIASVRPGADGAVVHRVAADYMAGRGYPTDIKRAPAHGFIHSLGHGVGIDIHELPHLGSRSAVLEEGSVITIEPGLYYPRPLVYKRKRIPGGGIRIEDMGVVRKNGLEMLTRFPKRLDDVIL